MQGKNLSYKYVNAFCYVKTHKALLEQPASVCQLTESTWRERNKDNKCIWVLSLFDHQEKNPLV